MSTKKKSETLPKSIVREIKRRTRRKFTAEARGEKQEPVILIFRLSKKTSMWRLYENHRFYSLLRATMGSRREAFRAG